MTVLTVHLAQTGIREATARRRAAPRAELIDGCQWLEVATPIRFNPGRAPSAPKPAQVVRFAGWDSDDAIDAYEATEGLPWHYRVRLQPVRLAGSWQWFDDIPAKDTVLDDDDETAVVTLAYTKPLGIPRFGRTSTPAETAAAASGATRILLGALRLPDFAATYSVWRTRREMLAYAQPKGGGPHRDAIQANRDKPFHNTSAFIRARPYAENGAWPHVAG